MTKRHARWIRRAAEAAWAPSREGYRLGAVAVRGGQLLGRGANRHRNDPTQCPGVDRSHWSVHAEHDCLKGVSDAAGATLYVVRIKKCGALAMARPCANCWDLIRKAGISRVVYSTAEGSLQVESAVGSAERRGL